MLLRIAWRNLARNPRRTGLTAAATVFAVVLVEFQLAVAAGSHAHWIDYVVRLYPGHVEVMAEGYREHRTLDYGMTLSDAQARALDAVPHLEGWAPRLETWALAIPDEDDATGRAAWLVGVDPAREHSLSRVGAAIGPERLRTGERDVLLGRILAENLGVAPGDLVILLASDYYGSQSADRFTVVGLLELGDTRTDSYGAIVSLAALRAFVDYPDGLSHVAAFARDADDVDGVRSELAGIFPRDSFEVLAWPELLPDLYQLVLLDKIGNYLMLGILVVVVAFGLLNTVLMSVLERVREFGVMRAMGLRPSRLFVLVLLESLSICSIGIVIGYAIAIPLVAYLQANPIRLEASDMQSVMALFDLEPLLLFRMSASQLLGLAGLLLSVSIAAALLPALRAARGRPVDALRED